MSRAALTPALESDLLRLGTATIYEASKRRCFLPSTLRPAWPGAVTVGYALPVRAAAGDNLPLHRAIALAEPGDVLVVDGAGAAHGYWGEVMAVAAQARGVRGLVIDGGVRDTQRLAELRFPVFSSHVAIEGTTKDDPGRIGEPVMLGGTQVARGDIIVADADGVVALPPAVLDEVHAASLRRENDEATYLDRLRAGELTLDIYGLRQRATLS